MCQHLAWRLGGMVAPDLVLVRPASGDGRPHLPLAIHRRRAPRAKVHTQAVARHAGTSRRVLQPAAGASATTTSLQLICL